MFLGETLNDNDEDDDAFVEFKQWTTTDRTDLQTLRLPVDEFIELLCEKLDKITTHSFIAKAQSSYLKQLKESLTSDEAIVLGDFAENYTFVVQDEIQSYHWCKKQCSLHPIVIYFMKDSLQESSFCVISDDLNHDVTFVHEVMKKTVDYIKTNINSSIKKIHYFSDGCAGQYKNCKHFYNLCHHSADFSTDCVWNFFATSHGKSPCDGIGGTVKRLVATASLQNPINNQILSAKAMFEFCQKSINSIEFVYITNEEMDTSRKSLSDRFSRAKTIPGTRSFHQYCPSTTTTICMKRVSDDESFALEFEFCGKKLVSEINAENVQIGQYLLCKYDDFYWIGMVSDIDILNNDFMVKFMHPKYPNRSFYWPSREDICWVPKMNIILFLNAPSLSSLSGRQYHLSDEDILLIEQSLKTC